MTKTLSCGIIVLNEEGDILLAHATGSNHWDIPKGQTDEGESPRDTALRETYEETGIDLSGQPLVDLGAYPYRPEKDLHLFATYLPKGKVDLNKCVCSTHFVEPKTGQPCPETDAFAWIRPSRIQDFCSKSLYRLFATKLSLYTLHEELVH